MPERQSIPYRGAPHCRGDTLRWLCERLGLPDPGARAYIPLSRIFGQWMRGYERLVEAFGEDAASFGVSMSRVQVPPDKRAEYLRAELQKGQPLILLVWAGPYNPQPHVLGAVEQVNYVTRYKNRIRTYDSRLKNKGKIVMGQSWNREYGVDELLAVWTGWAGAVTQEKRR